VRKSFQWSGQLTGKVVDVMKMFGLSLERLKAPISHKCDISLKAGEVCYITGPSGAGKTVLLESLYKAAPVEDRLYLKEIQLESDKSLIDCIEGDFFSALKILSKAGLSDVFCVLNQPDRLSDGQKYRYRLARALVSDKKVIFADEFCSSLDRITAAVIAHNIRKMTGETGKTFILASSHDDLLCDLLPDIVIIKHLTGKTEVIYRNRERGLSNCG
jgi:ABC-type ATPase with predicted acetyltransferase domain